ncbi:hypothetical protein D322_552 [Yersinia enterocolitica IP 10393]|nr:hypothetical protein D322_552 [Yersinia enterocolitica IP 10393]
MWADCGSYAAGVNCQTGPMQTGFIVDNGKNLTINQSLRAFSADSLVPHVDYRGRSVC